MREPRRLDVKENPVLWYHSEMCKALVMGKGMAVGVQENVPYRLMYLNT